MRGEPLVTYRDAMQQAGRAYWERTLRAANGNISAASRLAQVNRTNIYRVLRRYGVTVPRPGKRGRWKEFGL